MKRCADDKNMEGVFLRDYSDCRCEWCGVEGLRYGWVLMLPERGRRESVERWLDVIDAKAKGLVARDCGILMRVEEGYGGDV